MLTVLTGMNRPPGGDKPVGTGTDREGLGRSRGGLTSKIHLLADGGCRPLARLTSAGQRHDSLAFVPLLASLAIARAGSGRPRTVRGLRLDTGLHPRPADRPRNRAPTLTDAIRTAVRPASAAAGAALPPADAVLGVHT
jgi:hypothetical protein